MRSEMTVAEVEQITDSDNGYFDGLSRCGCPARHGGPPPLSWRGYTANVFKIDRALVGVCSICGAAWEWGYPCATEVGS